MRASWTTMVRVCREVAYGIDSMNAVWHGKRPSAPPYLSPSARNIPMSPPTSQSGASAGAPPGERSARPAAPEGSLTSTG